MSLELLPNELLFNIFQYLSTPDVLRAFLQLNRRFDELVDKHLYTCKYIDLRTTSKFNFDLFWKQYLAPLAGKIISLSLSNDFNTPDQVDQLYAHGITLRDFPRLRSLALFHIHSKEIMNKIATDLPYLTTLTHLTFEKSIINDQYMINIIWSLSNLVYFRCNTYFGSEVTFDTPEVTSPTIKSVHGFRDIWNTTVKAGSTGEEQVEQIVNTFRTPFWLDEHRWFVQCDWSPITESCYVYTLPYAFENFNIDFPICFKSTCAIDNLSCFYDRFSNIQHITIDLTDAYRFRYKNGQNDSSAYGCEDTVYIIFTFPISICKLYSIATIHETKSKLRQ
ncbi:unnamed protein product [Adineta steineri]|uniref:F-box domain-containing protein n=1 Tax=Adineta steineri TaxID=433720 RepID=A0A818VZA1_9BILA|nr:unnamed protein product [Adineta steineri]CAF3718143.1 unnamed protein product [Adineta steineri]